MQTYGCALNTAAWIPIIEPATLTFKKYFLVNPYIIPEAMNNRIEKKYVDF